MTGFGRGEHAGRDLVARVEIATVNRKQADIHFNLPRELAGIEPDLRKTILAEVSRGRVNVSIHLERTTSMSSGLALDASRARALEDCFRELSSLLGRTIVPEAGDFLRAPDIFTFEECDWDPAEAIAVITPALQQALQSLRKMRSAEGHDLKTDLLGRLDFLEEAATRIAEASPGVVVRQRKLLHARLHEAGIDLDPDDERFLKEVALFADRCDISEESTRLTAHLGRFREYLEAEEPVGRSLDFLCQELNREFNTIGSKANDASIGQMVVTAKTELEKIREQVQNLE